MSLNTLKNYRISILIATAIWIVCMVPVPETPLNRISFIDKWTHFLMYATLTITMLFEHHRSSLHTKPSSLHPKPSPSNPKPSSLHPKPSPSNPKTSPSNPKTSSLTICGLAALMGCLIELAQANLTTCRSGDWFDALCNTLGSLLGLAVYSLFMRLKR